MAPREARPDNPVSGEQVAWEAPLLDARRAAAERRYRWLAWGRALASHLVLILACLLVAAPLLYALVASTQTTAEAYSYPPKLTPGQAGIRNFEKAWSLGLGRMMLNSTFVAVAITVGKTAFSLLAALALVYFAFPGKRFIFFFILVTLMMPVPVRIVPLFDLVQAFKMGDTYYALILPFLASATGTFLFRQHFLSIPSDLVDAARVDGAGPVRFLLQILIPMSLNTIAALAVIELIYVWNQYLWPLIIISSGEKQVIQVGLKMAISAAQGEVDWGMAMAAVVMAMTPPLLVLILLQEQFMRGFALSREK